MQKAIQIDIVLWVKKWSCSEFIESKGVYIYSEKKLSYPEWYIFKKSHIFSFNH